jgi:3-phenylpropionate/cinnamic acid dioxygenase small subunit
VSDRDVVELNQLVYRYAAAVDTCDVDAFLGIFAPEARFRVYHPDAEQPFFDRTGRAGLADVPNMMRGRFRATAHMMTNPLVAVEGDRATGTVLCTARHLRNDAEEALTVVIRYVDIYERRGGSWLIADRQLRFLWSEGHAVIDSGLGPPR